MKDGLYEVGDMCRAVFSGREVRVLAIPDSRPGWPVAYVQYVGLITKLCISQKNLTPL